MIPVVSIERTSVTICVKKKIWFKMDLDELLI